MDKTKKELRSGKRPIKIIVILVFIIAVIGVCSSFVYKALNPPDYTETYEERIENGEIINPIEEYSLVLEEIKIEDIEDSLKAGDIEGIINNINNISLEDMEKDFVYYAAVQIKLYNLQEIPFTSIKPAIQIQVDERNYSVEISQGEIFVEEGTIENPDLILKTSYEEVFNMADESSESSSEGLEIEITASKFVLFSKGYLGLYQRLEESF